jgi:S-methylmethionine-dependent homocysteine/selenocysteine methylase
MQARHLTLAGSDLIVVETMNSRAEALAAASAASHTRLPTIVAFVTDGRGSLLSGDPLPETALAVAGAAGSLLLAIGVNCIPSRLVEEELRRIRSLLPGVPLAAWGNTGRPLEENPTLTTDPISPDDYAEMVEVWVGIGAQVVGGCCGTTSAHTGAVRRLLDRRGARSPFS